MKKKVKYNIWHIDAYEGSGDYNGPEQCNISINLVVNSIFSKESVIDMFMSTLNGRTKCVAKCEFVESGEVEVDVQIK